MRLAFGDTAAIGSATLPRYAYVVLSIGEAPAIRAIKAASPRTKVLAYQSATEAVDYCSPTQPLLCSSPVSYQQALAHDAANPMDRWLLTTADGASATMNGYPSSHLVDVGSANFRSAWARIAGTRVRTLGFDGIYMDNVLGRISETGSAPTAYPSDATWQRAMRGFVAYVGPRLRARGLYVMANAFESGPNDGSNDIAWWRSIAPYVSGLQSEYWLQAANTKQPFDTDPCCWTGHWTSWITLADAAQRNGADFFAVAKGPSADTGLMTYLRASYLLVWNGRGGGFAYDHEPADSLDPWNPAWTTYIGTPLATRYRMGVGWRRDFSRGTVIVNPDPTRALTAELGGRYATADGQRPTSLTLAPRSAAVLTLAG